MLNIGGLELLVILLVALVFLGPERLPQVARQVGQTVTSLRSMASGFQRELEAAARPDPLMPKQASDPDAQVVTAPGRDPTPNADADAEVVTAPGRDLTPNADADADPEVVTAPPTDPAEIGRAARDVSASLDREGGDETHADAPSPGGPVDLSRRESDPDDKE